MTRLLVMALMLLTALPALAARAELSMSTRDLAVGQVADLKLTVVEGRPSSIPRLESPESVKIRFANQNMRTLVHNTSVVRMWELTYRVVVDAEGEYTLGPYEVPLETGSVRTNTLTLRASPPPELEATPLAAEASFEPEDAWEGQVVLYRYRLTHRVEVKASQWTLPAFDGLVAPRDGTRPRKRYTLTDEHGVVAVDETWLPWVVMGTGDLTQAPASVRVDIPVDDPGRRRPFDPFGTFTPTRTNQLATEEAGLRVRPLPPAPPGFTGLVGDFDFEATLARDRAAVGESIDWKVVVQGDGSLEGFELPRLAPERGARVYEGSPTVSAEVQGGVYKARGNLSQVIVPTEVGHLELPPLEVITFSPSRGEYVTHTLRVPPLAITPGEEGAAEVQSFAVTPVSPQDTDQGGFQERDIRPPRIAPAFVAPIDRFLPFLLALAAVPGLGALGLLARRRLRALREARERGEVVITPSQRLKRLPEEPAARLTALDGALREALASRVGVEVARLDRDGALAQLPEELADRLLAVLEALDRARFGGGDTAVDEEAIHALVAELLP